MDIPTTKEELERKCIEMLTLTASQLERGAIDKRTAWVTAKTLWGLTAGLVSEEISGFCARMADESPAPGFRRYFVGNEPTKSPLILIVSPGRAYALVKVDPVTGERTTLKHRQLDPGDLEKHVQKIADSLKAGGYREI